MISEAALKRLGLDKVWWMVSPGNPLKKRSDDGAAGRAHAAVPRRWRPTRTSSSRISRPTCPSPYTVSTLAFLKARNPLVRFVWIMGADNLAGFDRWQRWREIFTMVPVVIVDRPGWRLKALASKAARAFAASRVAEDRSRNAAASASPGVDVPDGSPVARLLDGDPQPAQR